MVLSKVKKQRFFEKESFAWVIGSIVMLILAIFPGIVDWFSNLVGIDYGPSLLFFLSIMFILYLLFRQTVQVSLLKEQVKHLGQKIVVLEKELQEHEENSKDNE